MTERDIFLELFDIADPGQRAAALEEKCKGNSELRRRVEELLQAHTQAEEFLERPAIFFSEIGSAPDVPQFADCASIDVAGAVSVHNLPVSQATGPYEPPKEGLRTVIGPYKLIQQLGEGGMGTVYMAQQTEPVKRLVALKIIKAGMDSAEVLARFEQERQALAVMDHPNIAKVLDAGTTPGAHATEMAGDAACVSAERPYFVMELVKGIPITKYCDQEHLSPKERLELFIPVCQAVQHAHQKGIIHRDLKPSNVLIALYDGRPMPKVIDFGVAKATGPKLTEETMFTEVGRILGTLEYMAPEQAELNNLDIDTRADIYSLGVLLYELLTGTTPLGRKQLREVAFDEMLRIIREVEPPKPSTKLSSSNDLPLIAAKRKLEPTRLCKLVAGDLDWIVMKALEKNRGRRYETANGFAMDIQRYLGNEPVEAGPPSARYRLRKFIQRNKPQVVLGALVLVTLLAGIAGTTVGLLLALTAQRVANDEATHAREAERIANERLAQVTMQKGRAERHLRLLADALAPVNQGMGQSNRYDLFDEYLRIRHPEDTPLAFRQRIDDVEQALRELPEDIAKKVQLSRVLALHYLKYALSLVDNVWGQKQALQYCDKAVKLLEQDCVKRGVDPRGVRFTEGFTTDANRMIWPVLWLAYGVRADVLHLLGRYKEAHADYEQALDRDDDDPPLRLRYGDNLFSLGRYDQVAAQGEKLLALSDQEMPLFFALSAAKSFAEKVAHLRGDMEQVNRFAGLALRWLRRGLAQGHSAQGILNMLRLDDEFAVVRSRPEYQKLIQELESQPMSK
jgi:serine/threonine protein kinase